MEVFLETERLILRRFTMDDADLLFELDSDPEVMFWINGGLPPPREKIVLGYRLHRFAWSQGLATEGSRALIDNGFARHGVDRVNAETMAVNVGSRRVMEKAGLRYVRTFHPDWPHHIPGAEHGDVEYAIDRAQWEADKNLGTSGEVEQVSPSIVVDRSAEHG